MNVKFSRVGERRMAWTAYMKRADYPNMAASVKAFGAFPAGSLFWFVADLNNNDRGDIVTSNNPAWAAKHVGRWEVIRGSDDAN